MPNTEKSYAMAVDLAACIGCNACVLACKMEHDLPVDAFNTWIESWDCGSYPNVTRANLPKLCNHCDNAPCVSVCPTKATFFDENGLVSVDESRCIGCKYCAEACPFQVRWVNDDGAVQKCSFCKDRINYGLLPACVANCPTKSRIFGDLNDPNSEVSRFLAAHETQVLHKELGINCSVYYCGLDELQAQEKASAVFYGGRRGESGK